MNKCLVCGKDTITTLNGRPCCFYCVTSIKAKIKIKIRKIIYDEIIISPGRLMEDGTKKKIGLQNQFISFEKIKDKTLGEVFGTEPLPVSAMNKKIWATIRENNLKQ